MGGFIVVLLWHGDLVSVYVALLTGTALGAYSSGASNVHRLLKNSLRLGFENIALRRDAEDKTRLLEATLQNMRQGISLADAEGRLRIWNPQFVDLVGLSDREVGEGGSMQAVLSHARPPLELVTVQRVEYHREDGGVIEVAQNAMADGGRVITYTDITDRKRREAALEAARRNAEQANTAKTRFLAAASHDLRQPMHALGLLFATLADRVRNEQTAPLLDRIDDSVQAVDTMLNSLLDISKLDAGVVEPRIEAVDLVALFQRRSNEHQPIASLTGNRLRLRAANVAVRSDGSMLLRILGNLIANALRYTHHGRIVVGARRRGDSIRLDVLDTGPGIPPESVDEIFLEFHQLGNPQQVRQRSQAAPLLGADVRGRRVLVLDDEVAVLEAMRRLLERWGCEVITAASPEEAESRFTSEATTPDLLIVDYRLRRHASGIDAIGRLRELAGGPIPALIVTGDTAPDRLREAQASGYPLLHKPAMPAALRTAMRQLIHRRGAQLG